MSYDREIPKCCGDYRNCREDCVPRWLELEREVAELHARLEVNGTPYDGIAARDETIRLLEKQVAELREALEALVKGLDTTYWSSWQSTARFQAQLEIAREVLSKPHAQGSSE